MADETTPQISVLPDEDFQRVLCVVAHPDDVEYGTSSAVAHWVDRGAEVRYLLLTAGEAGMQREPAVVGPLRAAEQQRACEAVGVEDLQILSYPDGVLEYSLAMRRDIARAIREFQPDVVTTLTWDIEFAAGLNQADHRVAGLAVLDAIRDADNTWVFPELAAEGLAKWHVSWLLVSAASNPTHGVALTETDFERAVTSLESHREYFADLPPGSPTPRELLDTITTAAGQLLGVPRAMTFRAYQL